MPSHPKQVVISAKGFRWMKQGHPWIFKSDVVRASNDCEAGDIVSVVTESGQFLNQSLWSPKSQISLRALTRSSDEIDRDFWKKRLKSAIERRHFLKKDRNAFRLVNGESDLLPSLIIDQYEDVVVFQTLSTGMEKQKERIVELIQEFIAPQAIVERNDAPIRDLEGLVKQKSVVAGSVPEPLWIQTPAGLQMAVDPLDGQKTGLFLDQLDNHAQAAKYAFGRALDLFTYQGGFALAIAHSCDEVTAVDISAPALKALKRNAEKNAITNVLPVEANGFDFLTQAQNDKERFDTIVLDPPPFARDKKSMMGALRGYKEINLRAIKLLKPGGILISASCSQNFTPALFEETLREAARDTRREIQILERRGSGADHPTLLNFPESHYLQCWFLRVL